jgi:anionic cell wall polymer biosynthesis LytR-Cps2A-Psr (LCP) family protein
LGVSINYYAQVNLDSFVKIIDEIGGVKVELKSKMLAD